MLSRLTGSAWSREYGDFLAVDRRVVGFLFSALWTLKGLVVCFDGAEATKLAGILRELGVKMDCRV